MIEILNKYKLINSSWPRDGILNQAYDSRGGHRTVYFICRSKGFHSTEARKQIHLLTNDWQYDLPPLPILLIVPFQLLYLHHGNTYLCYVSTYRHKTILLPSPIPSSSSWEFASTCLVTYLWPLPLNGLQTLECVQKWTGHQRHSWGVNGTRRAIT